MHPDKSAAVIGLLDLRPGITPEDFEKALEELAQVDVWEVEYEATGRLPSLEVPVPAVLGRRLVLERAGMHRIRT